MQLNPGLGIGMGRKRKSGDRYPSGDLIVKDRAADDRVRAMRQPHRRALRDPDETVQTLMRSSEKAESALGRTFLRGHITAGQYLAGCRFAHDVGAYRAVIESPASTSGSGRGSGCTLMDPAETQIIAFGKPITLRSGSCWDNRDTCACAKRKAAYDSAFELLTRLGRRVLMAVNRLVAHDQEPSEADLPLDRIGLSGLERHYGLTALRRAN